MNHKDELKSCFDKMYSDGRALQYIDTYWSMNKMASNIKWLNEPFTNRTLKECIWKTAEDFMQFVTDSECTLK